MAANPSNYTLQPQPRPHTCWKSADITFFTFLTLTDADICYAIDDLTNGEQPSARRDWILQQLEEKFKRRVQQRLWLALQKRTIDPTRLEDSIDPRDFWHRPPKQLRSSWISLRELIRLAWHRPSYMDNTKICCAIEALALNQNNFLKRWALRSLEREFELRVRQKLELAVEERATGSRRND
jgi:hypothetical protein